MTIITTKRSSIVLEFPIEWDWKTIKAHFRNSRSAPAYCL